MKEFNQEINSVTNTPEIIEEILTSYDLFLVRNYIKRNNFMSKLTAREVSQLSEKFPHLHSSFDTGRIIEEFIYSSSKKLTCIICKKEFFSPFELIDNTECKGEFYHPKNNFITKSDKAQGCFHDGCSRKLVKGEYPCCHKQYNSQGCLPGNRRHLIVFTE